MPGVRKQTDGRSGNLEHFDGEEEISTEMGHLDTQFLTGKKVTH